MWKKIKSFLGGGSKGSEQPPKATPKATPQPWSRANLPEVGWLPDEDNRWGVPVLDIRPVTEGLLSTSRDPRCASNAVSFLQDDGLTFVDASPLSSRVLDVHLPFYTGAGLFDGALFVPRVMEEKWAIYYHAGSILFIRSWTRSLHVRADVRDSDGSSHIHRIHGAFFDEHEDSSFTLRALDYLLRSHAMDELFPAPLMSLPEDLGAAALWCFGQFGRRAPLATAVEIPDTPPPGPLRTNSLFHIAVARGDKELALAQLEKGVPADLLARDGLPALHWALACKTTDMVSWLLDQGVAVDVRSDEGATALMTAVQQNVADQVARLLARKADVNEKDDRGFTALHRAAELGHVDLVRVLLKSGADPSAEALGHTPLSLAKLRDNHAIVDLLR